MAQVFLTVGRRSMPYYTVKATQRDAFLPAVRIFGRLIAREAFARSISPRQNRSKPPAVPEMPTVMRTSILARNISAAAVVHGRACSIRPRRRSR